MESGSLKAKHRYRPGTGQRSDWPIDRKLALIDFRVWHETDLRSGRGIRNAKDKEQSPADYLGCFGFVVTNSFEIGFGNRREVAPKREALGRSCTTERCKISEVVRDLAGGFPI
jgi:hypothetical protein